MRRQLMGVVAGLAVMSAVSAAMALELPYRNHYPSEIDRKQFGYTDIVIDQSGLATVSTLFSNGKQWDGDHFLARIIFKDKEGSPIAAVEQKRGLDGSFGGKAREGRVTNHLRLSADQWARVHSISVQHKHFDVRNDREIWKTLLKLAEVAVVGGDADYKPASAPLPPSPGGLGESMKY